MTNVAPSKNAVYDQMELLAPKAKPTISGLLTLSGGQIKFPATQSASSDANTLDDYEEGTWTPVVKLGTTEQTCTAYGSYTKIGRFVQLEISVSGWTKSGTGNFTITGVPFSLPAIYPGAMYVAAITFTDHLVPIVSATTILCRYVNGSTGAWAYLTDANIHATDSVLYIAILCRV